MSETFEEQTYITVKNLISLLENIDHAGLNVDQSLSIFDALDVLHTLATVIVTEKTVQPLRPPFC